MPLVVLTTDRPHELRQVGAPQAMEQLQMYQNHVKLFVEMALPEATEEMLNYAYWQGAKGAKIRATNACSTCSFEFSFAGTIIT